MSIFRKRRGYWPMGERFAAFFRGPTIPPELVTLNVRPTPALNPVAQKAAEAPTLACGDYVDCADVPGFCDGCRQPKGAHSYESIAGAAIEAIPFKEPNPELFKMLGDFERAHEDMYKLSGVNDYFKCEKPT